MGAEGYGLLELTGRGHSGALASRRRVPEFASRLAAVADADAGAWRAKVLSRSCSLTLLAGSGSRWQKSLEAARAEGRLAGAAVAAVAVAAVAAFDPAKPRGLFPVRDFLGRESGGGAGDGPSIPIAAYSLAAVSGTGAHVVVVRGWEAEIRSEILDRLGADGKAWRFATQSAPYGKPLGHGDAAWQCRGLWRNSDWVVTNFGGDANSRHSIESALLTMAALDAAAMRREIPLVDCLVPATRLPSPAYPIELDPEGLPRSFGHNKLHGQADAAGGGADAAGGEAYCNVGVRVYRASALATLLEELRSRFWVEGTGYAIPGNDPAGAECALDNADAEFARRGSARLLPICLPAEITPAKSLADIPRFETAMSEVLAADRQ
jgi:hypothetical protein